MIRLLLIIAEQWRCVKLMKDALERADHRLGGLPAQAVEA
jgi:hypothetical protein